MLKAHRLGAILVMTFGEFPKENHLPHDANAGGIAPMHLPPRLLARIVKALRSGKQPIDIARNLGISLLVVADIVLDKFPRPNEL